jgi:hypothetical protein
MSSNREIPEIKTLCAMAGEVPKTPRRRWRWGEQGDESGLGLVFRWVWKHPAADRLVIDVMEYCN